MAISRTQAAAPRRSHDGSALEPLWTAMRAARIAVSWAPAIIVVLVAGIWTYARSATTWTADGDPALHLKLIQDIAATHRLPTVLPHFPARIAEGGQVQEMFPYGYTPLYHLAGALFYSAAGVRGVLSMNAIAAAVVAYFILRFVRARVPWYAAIPIALGAWISPRVQAPFNGIYMEPMTLMFVFASAWFTYVASATRSSAHGMAAGLLIGLAVATRQSALMYAGVLTLVVFVSLLRQGRLRPRCARREWKWVLAAVIGAGITAAPALWYLMRVNGGIGYGDLTLPFTGHSLRIDPVANGYFAGISKPDGSVLEWVARYRRIIFFNEAWWPAWTSLPVVAVVASGYAHLYGRGGSARFFAQWAALQLVIEFLIFLTLHGNSRYLILSQMLFFCMAPAGCYAIARTLFRWNAAANLTGKVTPGLAAAGIAAFGLLLFPGAYWDNYAHSYDRDLRTLRGAAYAEMGAWVNANTAPDSLILAPRVYSAELTFDREVTWVTFYGNAWVIGAIEAEDPRVANAILNRYGVDYVLIPDPPGTYIDRMPADGMRSFLRLDRDPAPYFELVYTVAGRGPRIDGRQIEYPLRIYRVVPSGAPGR